MEQYISKSALVAEIERRVELNDTCQKISGGNEFYRGAIDEAKEILSFLDTLEVKEVDFDTLGTLASHLIACDAHGVSPKYSEKELDLLDKIENDKEEKGKKNNG